MKLILAVIFLVGTMTSFGQKLKNLHSQNRYCHARSGLSLRVEANRKAEKDTVIPYGAEVKIISQLDSVFSINGLEGKWNEIEFAGRKGFVFSAYLSSFPVTLMSGKHTYLKDYAFDHYELTDGDKDFKMEEYLEKPKTCIFGDIRYQCTPGGYCDLDERLYLSGIGIQEALVIFASFLEAYNDYTFKRKKFSYQKEERAYTYSFYKENEGSFNQDIYMSYVLDKNGNYTTMTTGFDWEGGGGTLSIYKWNESMVCIEHTYSCH